MATIGAVSKRPLTNIKTPEIIPHAQVAIMKDKFRIQIRENSHSDGGPVIDICDAIPGLVKTQKIHFISKGDKQ